MWRGIGLLFVLLLVAGTARAQVTGEDAAHEKNQVFPPFASAPPLPIEVLGTGSGLEHDLEVGEKAPGFNLEGSGGAPVRLADLRGHWALLVFTYNHLALGTYKGIDDDLRKAGVRLYGVNQAGPEALRSFATREQLPFVILSDPTRQISQTFGMYDPEIDEIEPGIVLLDPQGVVQSAQRGKWLSAAEVLQLVRHSVLGA
jgi:thioredoxin-dependent peroxiredoxin